MIKHATSHGLATLVCTLSASQIIEMAKPVWPQVFKPLGKLALQLKAIIPWELSEKFIFTALVASILGLLWGIAFRLTVKRG